MDTIYLAVIAVVIIVVIWMQWGRAENATPSYPEIYQMIKADAAVGRNFLDSPLKHMISPLKYMNLMDAHKAGKLTIAAVEKEFQFG